MFAGLGFLLVLAAVSVSAEGQQDWTDPNQCFVEQFEELKEQRRQDMQYIFALLSKP